jgi:hypothetical protein
VKITYRYDHGMYLTCVNGRVEEAHNDLDDFIESLETFQERYRNQIHFPGRDPNKEK